MNSTAAVVAAPPDLNTAERRNAIGEAGKAADEFYKLYYKTLEMKPHRVAQLYLDSAVVIWDGNPYVQMDAIKTFFDNLPSLTFTLSAMDAQPLSNEAVGAQKTLMIQTAGTCRVSGKGNRCFNQNFVITAHGDKWKIASDVFRSQISPNATSS